MTKILIIDDDADIVELVKNRLIKNNYDVIYSNDGEEGFKQAVEHKPDLIIMDVMMPDLNGGETVKLLKSNDRTQHIPILFFTALITDIPNETQLDKINVNGQLYPALAKPFETNKLLSAIESLLVE